MICNVYWRGADGKLHNMLADDMESVKEAFQSVLEQLHEQNEIYRKPLLCLIKGGKSK